MNTDKIVLLLMVLVTAGLSTLMMAARSRARGFWVWYVLMCCCIIALVALGIRYGLNHQPHRITEDDPGWNCHTMGNRVCGDHRG